MTMIRITFQQNTTAYVKLLFRKAKSLSTPAAQAKHEVQKKTHLIFSFFFNQAYRWQKLAVDIQ